MHRYLALIALLAPLALAGCAGPSGPTFAQVAATLPPVPADRARLYFYRDYEPYESLSEPRIYLNGAAIGASIPGGVFYRDVTPGSYLISVDTEGIYWNQFKTVDLRAGQTVYVDIESLRSWDTGLDYDADTFVVVLVDTDVGLRQIAPLRLVAGDSGE